MRDKRPVDELSIEELERILAIRKREERMQKLKRMERAGRIVGTTEAAAPPVSSASVAPVTAPLVTAPAASAPLLVERSLSPHFEDEVDAPAGRSEQSRFWKTFLNQTLFLVEAAAVIGLVFLGYQMLTATNTLQQETASVQTLADEQRRANLPTLAPTPQIQLNQVVLPGGHRFTATGEIEFNYDEVPEALRYLVGPQMLQISARPPATIETALELNIPKLNLDQTIVQGTDLEALKLGIGQLLNGVNPGDLSGNVVLAGHNDVYSEPFRYLDTLAEGDEFFIRTQTQIFTYRVTETLIVDPNDVHVMNARDGATVTLISCYPYRVNSQRYIVYADRVT
ncbi:MAG: class D sortase [Anaerolineae bacterium]|nr:class D sortase [Anaerolineae bacterium]